MIKNPASSVKIQLNSVTQTPRLKKKIYSFPDEGHFKKENNVKDSESQKFILFSEEEEDDVKTDQVDNKKGILSNYQTIKLSNEDYESKIHVKPEIIPISGPGLISRR